MANYKTGAQRYNDRLFKIMEESRSEKHGLVGDSKLKGHGVNSPAMKKAKSEALKKKKEYTGHYRLDTLGRTRRLSQKSVDKMPKY